MKIVNRSTLPARPKKPYIQGANSFENDHVTVSLEEHQREYTIYLVPEVMDERNLEQIIRRNFKEIFEYELAAWMVDDSTWPAMRTYRSFREWFDVECHSVVCDLSNEELLSEEP